MQAPAPNERPLSPWAKAGLIASTAAIVLLFYIFQLLAALALATLLAGELILVIVLLRVGLSGWMVRVMREHVDVIKILLGSFWLRSKFAEFQIPLSEADAPELFKVLRSLSSRLQLTPPNEVQLEMSVNAWVRLGGLRSGAGKTRLGIGYDLLSGLSISEIEAVLAHELAHAKLVQRGFKRLANSALSRCGALIHPLIAIVKEGRDLGQNRSVAQALYSLTDSLTRLLARLVAAYSRQDEFEADRGAAEICGANSLRSALLKLNALAEASNRLPWRERVAQLQSGESYSEWFARELASNASASLANSGQNAEVFDKYATHPILSDRLHALPPDSARSTNDQPALGLLVAPDAIAQRLVGEIQRVSAIQEEKDSKALSKWARRANRRRNIVPLQLLTVFIFIGAAVGFVLGLVESNKELWIGASLLALASGWATFIWRPRYKDRCALPVPDYAELVEASSRKLALDQQSAMESEFQELASREKRKKRKVALLLDQAYKALGACDYLRAHVATRVIFKIDAKSVEPQLAFAIAAAVVNQVNDSARSLFYVRFHTGFSSKSTAWGAAWAFTLLGDWTRGESLLDDLVEKYPEEKTFQCLLAIARSRRGKVHSAIATARAVCTPAPKNKAHARLLIGLLLDAGLHREASSRLLPLEALAKTDRHLQLQIIRAKLLTRDFEAAQQWADLLLQTDPSIRSRLQLGHFYRQARQLARASAFFAEVQKEGHFPEALLALAQINSERHEKAAARELILKALNLYAPVPEGAVTSLELFRSLISTLYGLEDSARCSAWRATIPSAGTFHKALANTTYLIFATTAEEASRYTTTVLRAMDPNFDPACLIWKPAPKDEQPVRPARPGVQGMVTGVR